MTAILFRPNIAVTAVYAGLTASGYNLADPGLEGSAAPIIRRIREAGWPDDVLAYFSAARTATCVVNPYWPRAFLLTLAGLYMTNKAPFRFQDPGAMIDHVQGLDLIALDEKGPEVLDWLKRLPSAYAAVRSHPAFPGIWQDIQLAVNSQSSKLARIARDVETAMTDAIGFHRDALPPIAAIVNPLQAPPVDDYVHVNGRTYAITARPDSAPLIHEILHHVLNPLLEHERATIAKFHYLLKPRCLTACHRLIT